MRPAKRSNFQRSEDAKDAVRNFHAEEPVTACPECNDPFGTHYSTCSQYRKPDASEIDACEDFDLHEGKAS